MTEKFIPAHRYHPTKGQRFVQDPEAHAALIAEDPDWRDTPYDDDQRRVNVGDGRGPLVADDTTLVVDRSSGPNVEPKMNRYGEVGMGDTKHNPPAAVVKVIETVERVDTVDTVKTDRRR